MTKRVFEIRAQWDELARVSIATSEVVPGLCCEAPEFEELVAIVLGVVPDLLVANGVLSRGEASEVPVRVLAERREIARSVA
ncbi:MAG: DUF1902 domain-containing protein [Geminicoccaceae bacterium]